MMDKQDKDMKNFSDMLEKNYENFHIFNPKHAIELTYSVKKLADAWGISDLDGVIRNLKDGRSLSFWSELSISEQYDLIDNPDKNALYDASTPSINPKIISEIKVGIKTLSNNGLDLMQSGFKGRGFKNITMDMKIEALATSIILCDYHIIVDSIDAPVLYLTPVSSKEFLLNIITKKIKLIIKRQQFYPLFYGDTLQNLIKNNCFIKVSV